LAHVVQQTGAPGGHGMLARQLPEVAPEPEFEGAESREEFEEPSVNFGRAPVNENVQRPPVREGAPGRGWGPTPVGELPKSPYRDEGSRTNWAGAFGSKARFIQAESIRYRLESWPEEVFTAGGSPPDFVSVSPKLVTYAVTSDDAFVYEELR